MLTNKFRITSLVVACGLAFSLASCSNNDDAADNVADAPASITETNREETTETQAATQLEHLRIHRPGSLAFAAPFGMLEADAALSGAAKEITVEEWASPDELRALLVNGGTDFTAVPTYVAANMYNKDLDVKLAAVTVWGMLDLIGPDGSELDDWEQLRGETVMVPLPGDMPDLVFRYLAQANGLVPGEDFEIVNYQQPPEVVNRLVSGEGDWAVLPEHVSTVGMKKAQQNGIQLARVLNLQEQWGKATGGEARIPQAGVAVRSSLLAKEPHLLEAFYQALETSINTVNAAEESTVTKLSESSGVPAPVVAEVIPRLNLEFVRAKDARKELEQFYSTLAEMNPDIIGGSLPDADFYLGD